MSGSIVMAPGSYEGPGLGFKVLIVCILVFWLSVVGFAVWVIVKLLQHFGVI